MTLPNHFIYRDRIEAGEILAASLKHVQTAKGVVLAVPRGGIPVACVVAKKLNMPVNLLLTKKIGHPANKEYAIGAVSVSDVYITPHEHIPESYIKNETEKIRARLREMYQVFLGDEKPQDVTGKLVIIIDDGIATGQTLMSTIQMLRRQKPAKLIIAVPVSSRQAFEKLSPMVDEMICPLLPKEFWGVGAFYEDFAQVSDEEAVRFLRRLREEQRNTAETGK
jgi:predicted phosphoribosyltransferase